MSISLLEQSWDSEYYDSLDWNTACDEVGVSRKNGLPKTSKMGCRSYNLHPLFCNSARHDDPNEACATCFGLAAMTTELRGNYKFHKAALIARWDKIMNSEHWTEAMVFLIKAQATPDFKFRWHDIGDIQDIFHFKKIIKAVEMTPKFAHWIPTNEYGIVRAVITRGIVIPENLHITLSARKKQMTPEMDVTQEVKHLCEQLNKYENVKKRIDYTRVALKEAYMESDDQCPSWFQNHECQDCRICFDGTEKSIAFKKH